MEKKIRQYYNEELTLGKRLKTKYCEIDKKKALYGNRYSVLADINEFTPDEIEILHSLWKESFFKKSAGRERKGTGKRDGSCLA